MPRPPRVAPVAVTLLLALSCAPRHSVGSASAAESGATETSGAQSSLETSPTAEQPRARSAGERCLAACEASHCADFIGGGCFHMCNPHNLVDGSEDGLRRAAEAFETREHCAHVEVLRTAPPETFMHVRHLAYDGPESLVEYRLIEDAAEANANVVGKIECTPAPWDDVQMERDATADRGMRRVRCVADAYRDPARPTPYEDMSR